MKVLLVNGSPHEKGCTYTALSEIAAVLETNGVASEIFWLGDKPLGGCCGCGACRQNGQCVIDDAVNVFAAKIPETDGFVFGTPVHFAGASGAITSFMDRLFFSSGFYGKRFSGKPGAVIASCRRGGSTAALDQLAKYITFSNMPLVSSRYWNMVHGNTPAEVKNDLEGMQIMRTLGQNMAWLLKCIAAGKAAGVPLPDYEKPVQTNFIR